MCACHLEITRRINKLNAANILRLLEVQMSS